MSGLYFAKAADKISASGKAISRLKAGQRKLFSDEEKIRITKGMLDLSSQLGRRPGIFYAVDLRESGFVVQRLDSGVVFTERRIGWQQAAQIVETGQINWTDTITGRALAHMEKRRAARPRTLSIAETREKVWNNRRYKTQPKQPQSERRAEYLARKA